MIGKPMQFVNRLIFGAVALPLALSASVSLADPFGPDSTELRKYLVIGTGTGTSPDFKAVELSNVELGADQKVLSTGNNDGSEIVDSFDGDPNTRSVFVKDGEPNSRWRPQGGIDVLPGARPLFEGVDWTGNVAVTGSDTQIHTSNVDIHADLGIQCNRDPAACFDESSTNGFFPDQSNSASPLAPGNGIETFDPTALNNELSAWRDFVNNLDADATITQGIDNENSVDGDGPFVLDLDAVDAGTIDDNAISDSFKDPSKGGFDTNSNPAGFNDGIAVIDIDLSDGKTFNLNNSDWILDTSLDTFVIFRMMNGGCYDFSNSSIMLGGGNGPDANRTIQGDWNALFFADTLCENQVFNLNNVVLGGIALWDLSDFNPDASAPGDQNVVHMSNAQGCGQFIGHQVQQSDNRWNRCSAEAGTVVSEPTMFALFGVGLGGLMVMRRRRKQAA